MTNDSKEHDATLAATYAPRNVSSPMQVSSSERSNSYLSSTMRDGQIVATQSGSVSRTSTDAVASEAIRAANMPYTRAVNSRGEPVSPHQLTDDTRITLPNIGEMTLGQAKAHGFLPHNWSATGPNLLDQARQDRMREEALKTPYTQNETPKPEVHPDLNSQPLADPAVEQSVSNLVTNVSGTEQMEAIRGIIENGGIDEQTLGRAASQLSIEPEQLQQRMAPIMEAFKSQALAVMSEGGLDGNAVVEWAQIHARDRLNIAMNRQATQRITAGYAGLRQAYLEALGEHNPQAALNADLGAGNTSYKDDRGRVIVRMADGSTMLWKQAIRAFAKGH